MTPKKKKTHKLWQKKYILLMPKYILIFKQEYTLHPITLIKCQFNPLSLKVFILLH